MLSAALTEQFLTPQVLHHQRADYAVWYGYGMEFVLGNDGRLRNSYKEGVNAGASGIVEYYPADQLDVVVLSNAEEGAWAPAAEIHRRIRSDTPAVRDSGIGFN